MLNVTYYITGGKFTETVDRFLDHFLCVALFVKTVNITYCVSFSMNVTIKLLKVKD